MDPQVHSHDCPQCSGTGWQTLEKDGTPRAERCECWKLARAQQNLENARIPARYETCEFSTLTLYENEDMDRAVRIAKEFAASFPLCAKGLLLIGPTGIGKTHIAMAVLREVTLRGFHGIYYNTRELLSALRATYNAKAPQSEAEILNQVVRAELLVLDDLGAERFTEWMDDMMHLVIDGRYNRRLQTILTTNYPDDKNLENLSSLRVRIGTRIYSRLSEMCDFLGYEGGDYREFRKPPNPEQLKDAKDERPRGPSSPGNSQNSGYGRGSRERL